MKFPLLLLLLAACAPAFAQPPSATFRPTLVESYATAFSYSSASDVTRGDSLGEVSVLHLDGSASGRRPLNDTTTFAYGAAFALNEIDADIAALPDRLGELTVNLGVTRRFSPAWSGSLFARPGFYSDLEDFSADTLNVPALALANFAQSQDLIWTFGVSVNPFSDRFVFPLAGVRWKFAPAWTLAIGFPRAGLVWQKSETVAWRASFSAQGGSYRVTENLGVPATGIPRLANTYLDYRELRVGLGGDFTLSETLSLSVDAGAMTDRRFEYYDRNYTLNGDPAAFVTIALNGRF